MHEYMNQYLDVQPARTRATALPHLAEDSPSLRCCASERAIDVADGAFAEPTFEHLSQSTGDRANEHPAEPHPLYAPTKRHVDMTGAKR